MNILSISRSIVSAGISLLILIGCSGSNEGDNAGQPTVPNNNSGGESIDTSDSVLLSGPFLYQTGYTVVQGTQDNVKTGNTDVPNFTYTTDTTTNTTGNGWVSFGTPEIVYDEKGRGIEIRSSRFSTQPFTVSYNDDDSIASIAGPSFGDIFSSKTVFNYEAGRLVSKSSTRVDSSDGSVDDIGSISYTYADNGHLISAVRECTFIAIGESLETTYEFETDASGRITRSTIYEEDVFVEYSELTYDANGNIVEVNLYGPEEEDNLYISFTYTYTASVEPTVNLIGFMAATNDGFIPDFDLCPGLDG